MRRAYESNESLTSCHSFHEGYYDYGDLQKDSTTLRDFNRALKALEKRLAPASRSIFDIGFGNGFFLATAKSRGWQVAGIDSSPQNVQLAREKFSLDLQCGTLESVSSDARCDVAAFWDVIEHLPNPHEALGRVRNMLKPDGYLLIGIPNDHSFLRHTAEWLFRLSGGILHKGVRTLYFLEHVAYYTPGSLDVLLKKNGFEIVELFSTSTDLAKFSFTPSDRMMAAFLLWLGKVTHLENRFVAIYQKTG